jgi:Ca2+-dependent lipid-binding protein
LRPLFIKRSDVAGFTPMKAQLDLNVRITEAKYLPKMDVIGHTDAFCMAQMSNGPSVFRTKVISKCREPKWNEEVTFPVVNQAQDLLHLMIKDADTVSSDDPVSRLTIKTSDLKVGTVVDQWYEMNPVKGVKKGGRVHLMLHLAVKGSPKFVASEPELHERSGKDPSTGTDNGHLKGKTGRNTCCVTS